MRKRNLLLITLLISSLLAPQVFAGTEVPATTEAQAEAESPAPADVPAASPVITVGGSAGDSGSAPGLSTVTSAPSTVYPAGSYTVGTDIPAGESVLLADSAPAGGYGIYIIYENTAEDADYVDYSLFDYNAIIYLEAGQVLNLRDCTASPIDEIPQIDYFYGNMYKIGYHIPAGTYRLKAVDSTSYGAAYVLSYPSDNYDVVEASVYVEDKAAVTVRDGQYLQLSDCILAGTAPASAADQSHARPSDSQSDDWYGGRSGEAEEAAGDAQRTSLVTAGSLIPGLPTATSVPSTVYQPGTYQAGDSIPAREYVLWGNDQDTESYFFNSYYIISTAVDPQSDDQVIDSGYVQYNSIIKMEDGQYLTLSGCSAAPIDEMPKLDYRTSNHFKVGYHIPAGTYQFMTDDYYGDVYILSAPSQRYDDIVDHETIYRNSETVSLTVQNGQYLFLADCIFTNKANTSQSAGPGSNSSASGSTASAYLDYLKQLYGYEDEEEDTASPVITAWQGGERLSPVTTSAPATVYPAGQYQVGADIPAGEYMLLRSNSDADAAADGAYMISTVEEVENYDEIVDYNHFSYNAIIHLSEGQFLQTENCTASPIHEVPQLDYSKGEMYKVGLQLPAGTYRLECTDSEYSYGRAYTLSAPSDNSDDVIESFTVYKGENTVVTVADGQYLQLKRCRVAEVLSAGNSTSGPAFATGE